MEIDNVIDIKKDIVEMMEDKINTFTKSLIRQEEASKFSKIDADDELLERLKALGYIA